jgi:hypothetical protein
VVRIHSPRPKSLFGQHLMDELHRHRTFACGGGDALHASRTDAANREDTGTARFEQRGRAPQQLTETRPCHRDPNAEC